MKICSVCGNQCNDADDFCFMCGTKFVIPKEPPKKQMKFCMKCGKELLPNAAFCMSCGTPVGSTGMETTVDHQRRQVIVGSSGQSAPVSEQPGQGFEQYASGFGKMTYTADIPRMEARTESYAERYTRTMPAPSRDDPPSVPAEAGTQRIPSPEVPSGPDPVAGVPAAAPTGNSSIYIIEFLSALFKAHNIPVIIYMIMNVIFIAAFCFMMFPDVKIAIPAGLIIYIISLTIALSPVGESLLRFQTHCSPLTDQAVMQRVMPIFDEAKRRAQAAARSEGRSIPEDIELFYNDDRAVNAFATGRKTICFTKGILAATDEMLLAAFEHEFGHIAHHDTDSILLITVGNLIFSAIITLFRIGIVLGDIIFKIVGIFAGGEEGIFMILMGSLSRFLSLIFIDLFMAVWTGIGNLLVLKTSRSQEYKADEFAFKCGKGRELQAMLTFLEGGNLAKSTGLFATLKSSHPDTVDRIAALQQLEATSVPVVR